MDEEWNHEMSCKWIYENPYISSFQYKAEKSNPKFGTELMNLYYDCIKRDITPEMMRKSEAKTEWIANNCALNAWEIINAKIIAK